MLSKALFLDPMDPYFQPTAPDRLAKMSHWLTEIADAFRQGDGAMLPQVEGVDAARFGRDDVRRVLFASVCEQADRPRYFVELYASLRDGRFVRLYGEYAIRRDEFRKDSVYVQAWKQADWDPFYEEILKSLPDREDFEVCEHICLCGTVLEFLR